MYDASINTREISKGEIILMRIESEKDSKKAAFKEALKRVKEKRAKQKEEGELPVEDPAANPAVTPSAGVPGAIPNVPGAVPGMPPAPVDGMMQQPGFAYPPGTMQTGDVGMPPTMVNAPVNAVAQNPEEQQVLEQFRVWNKKRLEAKGKTVKKTKEDISSIDIKFPVGSEPPTVEEISSETTSPIADVGEAAPVADVGMEPPIEDETSGIIESLKQRAKERKEKMRILNKKNAGLVEANAETPPVDEVKGEGNAPVMDAMPQEIGAKDDMITKGKGTKESTLKRINFRIARLNAYKRKLEAELKAGSDGIETSPQEALKVAELPDVDMTNLGEAAQKHIKKHQVRESFNFKEMMKNGLLG
jgi:hypothetical protein